MTKFEWERQLKKGISSLPQGEQQRVLEYYNELFSDKIDAGMKEMEIVAEFGNPFDVANKILVDFYSEGKSTEQTEEYVLSNTEAMDDEFDTPIRTADTASEAPQVGTRREHLSSHVSKNAKSASGLIALICVLLFFVLGAFFNKWHPAWMLFVAMPVVITLVEAIEKRNWRIFAYPVFVVVLYLLCGFYGKAWHPMWVLFLTIPLYYVIGDYVSKKTSQTKAVEPEQSEVVTQAPKDHTKNDEQKQTKRRSAGKIFAGVVLTIVLVSLMITVWSIVIGLFVSGISMMIGGVAALAWAILNLAADHTFALMILGGSLAVIGLGLVFTFGMASVFKYCAKMCKSFGKTIADCFE